MTDETKLREVIADVRTLREHVDASGFIPVKGMAEIATKLGEIERKLGGLLPPIGGQFNISLDTVIKPR